MKTQDIYDVLNGEREYQKRRWGERQPDGSFRESNHEVGEYLVYMQDYLTAGFHALTHKDGSLDALDALRKVVTLGIGCFEEHGIRRRDLYSTIINARDGLKA
jgi:hypothetical protein